MRPGRKSTPISVNTKPITLRSCAVRVEKSKKVTDSPVSTPNVVKINNNNTTFQQKSLRSRRSSTPQTNQQLRQQHHVVEEKKFRGPLKKRPVTAITTPTPVSSTTISRRDSAPASTVANRSLTKTQQQQQQQQNAANKTPSVVIVKKQAPATVAASRTRRAIKPNPKYTSEDMVTPRMMKSGAVGGSISLSKHNDGAANSRGNIKARTSGSSLEDFFSRESSVELPTEFDEIVDKAFDDSDKDYNTDSESLTIAQQQQQQQQQNNTSNAANTSDGISPSVPRRRGRPRREINQAVDSPVATNTATIVSPKPALSKINTNANIIISKTRSGTPLGQKRKSMGDDKDSTENDMSVTRKRFLVSTSSTIKKFKTIEIDEPKQRIVYKTSQVVNDGSVITDADADESSVGVIMDVDEQEDIVENNNLSSRRKQQFNKKLQILLKDDDVREMLSDVDKTTLRKLDGQTKITANNNNNNNTNTNNTNINNNNNKRTNANANKSVRTEQQQDNNNKTTIKRESNNNNDNVKRMKVSQEHKNVEADESIDEDGMPCFTIVNINDIISKKGDAKISKSSSENAADIIIKPNIQSRNSNISRAETLNGGRKEVEKTNYEKKLITKTNTRPPQTILNHQLATRSQLTAKNKTSTAVVGMSKPAPRILNAMVAKKTQPVKPVTANPNDSADESLILSLDEDDEDDNDAVDVNFPSSCTNFSLTDPDNDDDDDDNDDVYNEDDDSNDIDFDPKKDNTRQVQKRSSSSSNNHNNKLLDKKRLIVTSTPSTSSSKENKLPKNQQYKSKLTAAAAAQEQEEEEEATNKLSRRLPPEKVEISRQGDKIIKKITCLENWYVITRNKQPPKSALLLQRNTVKMPIINLANIAVNVKLPSAQWNSKVTLYELPSAQLAKGTYTTYTGSLKEYNNISEDDRHKFQPSCVMFRRAVNQRETSSRLPYDRAVIFKNNTFFTNIDGKNVKLIAAPTVVQTQQDVELLVQIIDSLSLSSPHVELTSSI